MLTTIRKLYKALVRWITPPPFRVNQSKVGFRDWTPTFSSGGIPRNRRVVSSRAFRVAGLCR